MGCRSLRRCCCKCCKRSCFSKYTEYWAVGFCCAGIFLMTMSLFTPRWRVDPIGTRQLEAFYFIRGFNQREYGLIQVKGSYSQSWNTIASSACEFRTYGLITSAGHLAKSFGSSITEMIGSEGETAINVTSACKGSESCAKGFSSHMWSRCHEYEKMWKVSLITMIFTFVAILMGGGATFVATLSTTEKTGGVTFGLFLTAGVFCLIVNLVWAVASDLAFKKLQEQAWFPYPSLAIGYFLHLYGVVMLLTATGVFGYIVLPETWSYDPVQAKIDKRNRRLQKIKANARLHPHHPYQFPPNGGMVAPMPPGAGMLGAVPGAGPGPCMPPGAGMGPYMHAPPGSGPVPDMPPIPPSSMNFPLPPGMEYAPSAPPASQPYGQHGDFGLAPTAQAYGLAEPAHAGGGPAPQAFGQPSACGLGPAAAYGQVGYGPSGAEAFGGQAMGPGGPPPMGFR